jgi:hypothetical protein
MSEKYSYNFDNGLTVSSSVPIRIEALGGHRHVILNDVSDAEIEFTSTKEVTISNSSFKNCKVSFNIGDATCHITASRLYNTALSSTGAISCFGNLFEGKCSLVGMNHSAFVDEDKGPSDYVFEDNECRDSEDDLKLLYDELHSMLEKQLIPESIYRDPYNITVQRDANDQGIYNVQVEVPVPLKYVSVDMLVVEPEPPPIEKGDVDLLSTAVATLVSAIAIAAITKKDKVSDKKVVQNATI